jgi:RNA polymerase-binding transcription factor DksA
MAKKTSKKPAKKKASKKPAVKKATRKPAAKKVAKKPARKAAKKKTAKKVAKKPARKAAKKKTAKKVAKKPARKAAKKKTAKKVAKKPARKAAKKPAKKSSAKTTARKAPAKKASVRKAVSSKDLLGDVESNKPDEVIKTSFKARELNKFRKLLLNFRDRLVDEVSFLAGDNLSRNKRESSADLSSYSFHMADQGTDNADREFALKMVSSEQDMIYEVEEALRRIDSKTYGVCEISGKMIEIERLEAIPHTRYSMKAQTELEKNGGRKRNFGIMVAKGS